MPSRRSDGNTTRRKHSLGNLRRAHPASGAAWNVQVVRGKMSSKCLWHACRALILGLTLMLLGAAMAVLGYHADNLSINPDGRVNATAQNNLKGFHLNNFSYVGPIVMGFGGFIVVASCVMTFEARDSAAKVVPARLRASGSNKTMERDDKTSAALQRRALGMQIPPTRWDHQFGVFRLSPDPPKPPKPFDRNEISSEFIKFSESLSSTARFSPQLRRFIHGGSVPNLPTYALSSLAYSTNVSNLILPSRKPLLLEHKRHHQKHSRHHRRDVKSRGTYTSNSLIQRTIRQSTDCKLLQPPMSRLHWHTASFDEGSIAGKHGLRTRCAGAAKRHVLSRQKPIEQDDDRSSTLCNRRSSTISHTSHSDRWMIRCASFVGHIPTVPPQHIQVDLHSPKSTLPSPKYYCARTSGTSSMDSEFKSELSVCSEPPAPSGQLSGQSSLERGFPKEISNIGVNFAISSKLSSPLGKLLTEAEAPQLKKVSNNFIPPKRSRPDLFPLNFGATMHDPGKEYYENKRLLRRNNSSRLFYRPRTEMPNRLEDSIFYIKSSGNTAIKTNETDA